MAQKQFIIDGGFSTNANSELVGNLEMTGHVLPTVDSDGTTGYDLGSPSLKWRDLYLSQGSLYIDGQKVIESDSGTIVVTADPDQSLTTKVTGTGVLTFQSATTVSMASTLQMGSGKKITDQGGSAVTFGDKIDMDNNQVINVGAPTADGHATTKLYVDGLVNAIATDAITEGDTEIEIADLGTGTVGITVDGVQRLALSASAAAFTVPVTVLGQTLANEAYADQAEADAKTYADGIVATATTASQAYADQAEADAKTYADAAVAGIIDSAPGALDTLNELAAAMGDDENFAASTATNIATAKSQAMAYTDTRETAITTAYQSYADTAEADAISTAAADATSKANAALASAQTYADTAEADAISTASTDATNKADAALVAAKAYADTAEADARAYTDTEVSALIAAAPGALDTLNELAAAIGDDSNYAATTTTAIATAKSAAITTASDDATAKANAAQAAAISTASTDATSKANAAQAAAEATASADATSKVSAEASARATAIANAVAGIEANISTSSFHSGVTDVTNASTVAYTFSEMQGADDYTVYVNRQLVRPAELSSVNLSTGVVTFASSILELGDEIEVKGWKLVS